MTKHFILVLATLTGTLGYAQENSVPQPEKPRAALPPGATNALERPQNISIQEMLVIGPSGLKLHALAMVTQGKYTGEIDESFLPGLKVCAADPALPVRSVTARILGDYLVKDKEKPNPDAIALLRKLARDDSFDVRFSAVYYGLTQIQDKSDEVLKLLIDIAAANREQSLYDRIVESIATDRTRVTAILDAKLREGDNVAIYEIYQDLTGQKPPFTDKYMEMPSSRPRLYIFKGAGSDPEAFREKLEKALRQAGLENPDLSVSGNSENYVLLLKTYITKDCQTVEKAFGDDSGFSIYQQMWLTPEVEIQIDAMKLKK